MIIIIISSDEMKWKLIFTHMPKLAGWQRTWYAHMDG